MQSDKLKSYLHLHVIVFIWGFTAVLGKLISLDALPLVWYRMLFAVGFIYIFIRIKKLPVQISKKDSIRLLIAGLIIALHWFTFFKAIKVSNISITLACLSTGAFFTSLIEPIFFRKKIIWTDIFFGIIVIIGLYFIAKSINTDKIGLLHSLLFRGNKYLFGIILALISAFLSASFAVINSYFVQKINPTIISYYELSGGVLFLTILLLFSGSFSAKFFQLSASDFGYLLILSSVCTAYAFIASTAVMKFLSPYTVMLTINLEPIYGIILAILFFEGEEKMNNSFYIGALIILITVVVNGLLKFKK